MATVKTETNTSSYVGMTRNSLKTRYYNHLKCFNNKRYRNETKLSKYLWTLKEEEVEHTIVWGSYVNLTPAYYGPGYVTYASRRKVRLLSRAKPSIQLNRRVEVSTCSHVSPPKSIAPTSKLINTEPNRPTHLSEDHHRHQHI